MKITKQTRSKHPKHVQLSNKMNVIKIPNFSRNLRKQSNYANVRIITSSFDVHTKQKIFIFKAYND